MTAHSPVSILPAKMKSDTSFWQRLPGANRPIAKWIAGGAFLFFLIKGLIWLGVLAALGWAAMWGAS